MKETPESREASEHDVTFENPQHSTASGGLMMDNSADGGSPYARRNKGLAGDGTPGNQATEPE